MAAGTLRTTAQGATAGTKSDTISSFIPSYWDSVLGENLYPNLYLYQFGTKRQLPRNFGLDIKIPRLVKQNIIGSVVGASEGKVIGTSPLSSNFISGVLKQFAGAYRHSDVVIMTALSDVIDLSLRDIGRDIAKRMDSHVRAQLSGKTVGGIVGGGGTAPTYAATSPVHSDSLLLSSDILKAAVLLDSADNPRPADGHYPFITHPKVVYDLQASLTGNSWLEMNKFGSDAQVQHYYRGEVGRIFGARVVTSTNVDHLLGTAAAASTGMSAGEVSGYRSMMFAPDAYYVTEISDMTAKTFVKQLGSAGALDPVNQVATVGAKVFFTAIPANWGGETRMIRVMSGGSL